MLEANDLHWLAGYMEGEGTFGLTNHRRPQLYVEVSSTDREPIDRIDGMISGGFRCQHSLPSGKVAYRWGLRRQELAAGLMMTLYSLMVPRRQRQIQRALDVWRAKPIPRKLQEFCVNGHALSGDNLWLYQEGKYLKRRCRACGRERQRKHREHARQAV